MYTILIDYDLGGQSIFLNCIADACKVFSVLDNDPNTIRVRILDPNGRDITDQRYDQE